MLETQKRILYFDYLRIFSVFSVIVLHVSAVHLWDNPGSISFFIHNAYNSAVRWSVPVFVMISGALFLDPKREITIGKLHKKNLLRLITAFIFWSLTYAFVDYLEGVRLRDIVFNAAKGHVHLWYLYLLAGLYLVVPILRKITESKMLIKYFLIVWFLMTICIQTAIYLSDFIGSNFSKLLKEINGSISFKVAAGYSGYFILGYYLNNFDISKKKRVIIYILGVFGFSMTFVLPVAYLKLNGSVYDKFSDNLSLNVFLEAISVFVIFKYIIKEKANKNFNIIRILSDCSFGIYLVHMLINEFADKHLGIDSLTFNPIISIPLIALGTFIASFGISFILKKIPFINRYIV